nr:RNA-directed DNA polymerase, eukaryota [Tanacetum cinerariifolium]
MRTSISFSFRRPIRGGVKSQQHDPLSVLLYSVILSNMKDRWFWDLSGDGVFRVKDVRILLDEAFIPKMEVPTRWIKSISIKVNVFAWKLFLDRLPTRSNLARRNVLIPFLACPLCDHALEGSSHLVFGCFVAKDVQKLICRWWNLDFQSFDSYDGWLSWFKSIRLGSKTKDVLEGVFYVSCRYFNMVMSGSQRSKEDDVQKISTSVFVTNFPDGYGAKDLWNTSKLYGHAVDVFIPNRRTKAGKRFGFVRFIKVLDIDRLINNLCTVWVGHNKIHANVARFQREPLHKQSNKVNNKGTNNVNHGAKGMANSYAHVVKENQVQNVRMEEGPNMVLDETCLNHEEFLLCLLGKVKEFASLTNLKVVLGKEGYVNIELKYMGEVPGWVPDFEEDGEEGHDVNDGSHEDDMYGGVSENLKDVEGESDREEVPETNFKEVPEKSIFEGNSVRHNYVHSEDPFDIYEVLNKKRDGKNIDDKHEDSLKYLPGFTPNEEGDVPVEKGDNWSDENKVNDGQEDGKINDTVSDYFIMVRGVWVSSGKRLLLISVYAPQDLSQKKMLWDYLSFVMGNLDGEVVIMGDFNKVRDISERFGSIFNKHGAEAFNSFIVNAGLVEVPLGGCSFTWCHKSAKKMSKLMCSCHSISSTSLDRFLSDHRPIIMREAHYDYGPIPFKFFYYWFELDGFDKLVEQTWLEANMNDQNSYSKFMNKLKYLKEKIRIWTRLHKESLNSRKSILKDELADLDGVIDKERVQMLMAIGGGKFEKPNKSRILLERDFVKRISLEQNDDLEREVSNEEIKMVVWDCGIDKAPGPDGFTFGFYRRYWDIIGNDVVDAGNVFFAWRDPERS